MRNLYVNNQGRAIPGTPRVYLTMLMMLCMMLAKAAVPTISSFTPTSGCSGSMPLVTINGNHFNGSTVVKFNGLNAASFTVVSNTQITATPAVGTTTGAISITNASGTGSSGSNFTINASPTATISNSGPTTFCVGSNVTMTASGGTSYLWSTGLAGAAITVNVTNVYTVTVTNAAGCTDTAMMSVTVNPLPTPVTVSGAGTFCDNATLTATGGAGGTIYWENTTSLGTSAVTPSSSQSVTSSGTYYFRANNACGWGNQGSAVVTINYSPVVAPITGTTTICSAGTVTLSDVTTGGVWSSSNTGVATISAGGVVTAVSAGTTTISYAVTTSGCTTTVTTTLTVLAPPAATTVSGGGTFCNNATLTATGGAGGTIYWENTTNNGTSGATPSSSQVVTTSGTYYFRAANGCGWGTQGSASVTINSGPAVSPIVGSTTVCVGSTTLLTDATLLGTWSSSNTAVATVTGGLVTGVATGTATISYTVTNILNGCSTTVTTTVTVNDIPSATTVTGGTTQCGGTVTLNAAGGTNGTIYWENTTNNGTSTAIPSASQTVPASGTYYFRANNACGWSAQGSQVVTINAYPVVAAITGTTSVCVGSTTPLSDATASGVWSSSNTAVATISAGGVVTGISAGTSTISYTVTSAAGCVTTVTTTVTVNAVPVVTPITGSNIVCLTGVTALSDATSGGSWSSSNTAVATVNPSGHVNGIATGSATISYSVTNASGCTTIVSMPITVSDVPAATTVSGGTTQCGGTVTLNAGGGAGGTIYWENTTNNGTSTATAATSQVVSTSGTYYFRANNTCGWGAQGSAVVTINAIPVVAAITGTTTVCAGSTTTLSDATASGVWSSSNTAIATISAGGIVTGVSAGTSTISYTVTSGAGCSTTVTTTVTVNAVPTPTASNATSCAGATVTLNATGGVSYLWSTGATSSSITTATAGFYSVTATNALGCKASAQDTVFAIANPTPSVTNPAVCAGNSATITASGAGVGGTYLWSTGATTASFSTTTAGVYNVTVTNSSGCSATASGIVTINALPTPAIANDTICAGGIATLTATGGAVYVWSTGAHTASITTAAAGTYTVTATSMGSCTASASGTVTLTSNPVVTTTNGVICSGTPTTLTASGGTGYVWSNGFVTSSITVSTAGTYTVTASNANGCTASANATATTSTYPTPTVNNPTICAGANATLTATGGATYLWSTGATTASITISPASTTTYTVTATNAAGCSATASGTVTVNALPTAASTNGTVCTGVPVSPATLTASGGTSYLWSTGATTATITTAVVGTYTVTVTNAATCTATASGIVTSAAKPVPTVNSATVCNGTSATLTATSGTGYVWSTGAVTASITVTPAVTTTYSVTATNAAGCTASASGVVTVYSKPTATAASNSPILLNGTINLTSTVAGGTIPYTYSWSGPSAYTSAAANPSIASAQPTNGGVYSITVSDLHGCTANANTTVILNFTSPGGITSNDALWLNANVGVATSGSNLTAWNDQSGLNNNATTVNGTAPTLVTNAINSYPAVNFIGTGGMQGAFGSAITSSATSSFIVSKALTTNALNSGMFSVANTTGNTSDNNSGSSSIMFMTTTNAVTTYRNNIARGNYTNANALGNYHLLTSIFSSTANNDLFYNEGVNATNGAFTSASLNANLYTIGSRFTNGSSSLYLRGQIAEVILFNIQLSAAQKNQVESYLATKYGMTLDQTTATNYVASNGTTFWNSASNVGYKNNIFGVGIDNISTLNQTQSVSLNTSQLSLNSATGLTYYSFLMVSDNGKADTLNPKAGLPNSINAALTTVWRASQTGSRATANFVLNTSTINFNYFAPISASMTPYMLIDSNADGTYETYLAASSTSGSNVTFNASLNDGALFTFGFKASIDYGDAPTVPTLIANNGAGHMIVAGIYLGNLIDAELDGQPSVNSLGDDTIGVADEDGVNFNIGVPTTNNIVTMGTNTITVKASVAGYLNAWADFNQDGTYGGGSEYAIQNFHLAAGLNTITFNVSDSVEYGPTSMRFRFAQNLGDVTAPTGLATNGEVEDYKIYVTAPLVGACTNGFQNPGFELGPDIGAGTYIITSETNLPYWRTTATDHMIEQWGNNFNGGNGAVPAHGGTYFVELEANLYGALYQDVYTTPGTKLTWSFAHRGRMGSDTAQMLIGAPGATVLQSTAIDGAAAWGMHSGTYTVPAGQYITRLEFLAVGSYGGNNSIGNFLDDVSVISSFDYGDAPNSYGTLFASNGPYHAISTNLYLGAGVTCDADGQPSATASLDGLDDGVTFPLPCNNCNTYTVSISAYNNTGSPATIAGWIDFNKNGVFDNGERQSVTIPSSATTQTVSMTFTITTFSATTTGTFARFRIANDSTEIATPYGYASAGEVEDYQITCVGLPIPVPTATTPACARGTLNLTSSGSAPFYTWTGPNGYTSNLQNPTRTAVPAADSGYYRVYAIYANGCERDSAVKVVINSCVVSINGAIFDDANGNGIIDGTDATSSQGKTIYAVLADNTNTVVATTLIAANGGFTFTNAPAYMSGLTIVASTTNPTVGAVSGGPLWPARWVGTKEQYGTNNLAGTGSYAIPNLVPVNTSVSNITGLMLGYDQLPSTTIRNYTIPYPHMNSKKSLTPANGLGLLAGSDPEDGVFTAGSTFTITSLSGMNGNTLYYDANGDGVLQSYEQITGYTTITNFDPTKLIMYFTGAGSMSATFTYGSTDAASKVDPTPATYTVQWVGTLPVKMLYFTAQQEGETQSLLKWATATEIDNDHFDIERSADGQNWSKIGEQRGAGTTSEQQNYSMVDPQPLSGTNYYRLKQVDVDGNFTYSDIAEVTFGTIAQAQSETTLSVYPNPLNQSAKLNIDLSSATEQISEVNITNSIGQIVYSTNLPQIQNYQIFGLNLPSGVYIVSVRTQSNTVISSRLVITK